MGGWLILPHAATSADVLARMTVKWEGDLGRTGTAGPRHWLIETGVGRLSAVIPSDDIRRQFGALTKGGAAVGTSLGETSQRESDAS